MKKFVAYGNEVGKPVDLKLDEVKILANPETFLEIGLFMIKTAYAMQDYGLEHKHLQDEINDFSHKRHVDLILLNKKIVK
ncbi:hypothetical protein [Neisseria zalophi]|uniref:Uncharacterized protein n=1 Tax=Neisseria zalophi TaxID=640030 RepID=A0A5J6PTH3_9NEIS|nr:hypothetical protein [Neisseria zalophi]QEY26011.1 hypothetical protein D0T92_05335 [Neisseria zalophi]